jgi:hypothetical protein
VPFMSRAAASPDVDDRSPAWPAAGAMPANAGSGGS